MLIDLLAAAFLIGLTALGAVKGTLASGLRMGVLVLAYLAAWFAATQLGGPLGSATGLLHLLAAAVAGAIAFVGVFVILSFVSVRLLARDQEMREDGIPRSTVDRVGGGALGAAQGVLIALLLGWLGLWIEAGRASGSFDSKLLAGPSIVRSASQNVVSAGARAALGDEPGSRMGANLIANPAGTVVGIQSLLDNPRIISLRNDREFWQYVSAGSIDQALNRTSFLSISHDATLRGQLVDLGVLGESARTDPRLFRTATRDLLRRASPALRDLRNDPELRKLARDPEIQRALSEGETLTLLAHPGFQRVFARALAGAKAN